MNIEITTTPNKKDIETISQGIINFNNSNIPNLEPVEEEIKFYVFVRNEYDKIIGGIRAVCFWNTMHIELLWLNEDYRGKGLGQKLIKEAENFAKENGSEKVFVETTSWQAKPFFEKAGYTLLATLNDRPKGHAPHYLTKDLLQNIVEFDENIKVALREFINTTSEKSKYQKRLFHFHSVINLAEGLVQLKNDDLNEPYKVLMMDYFEQIKNDNYQIGHPDSLNYFNKYLLPIGKHMIRQQQFGSNLIILKYFFIGLIMDIVLSLIIDKTLIVFLPSLTILFFFRRKFKIKQKRFFSINW